MGGKVNLSLILIQCYAMKTWGSGSGTPAFLTSVLYGYDLSSSYPCCFNYDAHSIGSGWPTKLLWTLGKREKSLALQESNPYSAHNTA
jgi:hypothetical protein